MNESLTPIEKSFTSLIQQYLSLLLHDNATFLAERMVAHSPTLHSTYLHVMGHFRCRAKRARSQQRMLSQTNQGQTKYS